MLDNISKNISNWSSGRICSILEVFYFILSTLDNYCNSN